VNPILLVTSLIFIFQNFVNNVCRRGFNESTIAEVWTVLECEWKAAKQPVLPEVEPSEENEKAVENSNGNSDLEKAEKKAHRKAKKQAKRKMAEVSEDPGSPPLLTPISELCPAVPDEDYYPSSPKKRKKEKKHKKHRGRKDDDDDTLMSTKDCL